MTTTTNTTNEVKLSKPQVKVLEFIYKNNATIKIETYFAPGQYRYGVYIISDSDNIPEMNNRMFEKLNNTFSPFSQVSHTGYGQENGYYWSDNGGDSDGGWVAKLDDIISGELTLPTDLVMPEPVNGYEITGYTSSMQYLFRDMFRDYGIEWCGWSAGNIAFVCDVDNNRFAELMTGMAEILLAGKEAA